MTPPTDLPRRFAACKNWKWEEGMKYTCRMGVGLVQFMGSVPHDATPILAPSTMGCILARIRTLRNDSTICHVYLNVQGWAVTSPALGRLTAWHDTEEEAYLDALEGCP